MAVADQQAVLSTEAELSAPQEPDESFARSLRALGQHNGESGSRVLRRAIQNAAERIHLERRVKEQQRELEDFVSLVAHDLRSPLCAAQDSIDAIRDCYKSRPLDEAGRQLAAGASRSLRRMSHLIDSLLGYASVRNVAEPTAIVDLNEAMRDVLADLQPAVREANAAVEVERLPSILGDAISVRRLLQNLLANAIKFHGELLPSVHVSAGRQGDNWRVLVADNGIGIAPDAQARIFEPFERLHRREQFDGAGLGLASCKKIVEQFGGEIGVESEPGEGATFWFTCPVGDVGTKNSPGVESTPGPPSS